MGPSGIHLPSCIANFLQASWHEERRLTSAGPAMGEAFRRCRLTVCRCGAAAAAREGAPASPFQGSAGESAGSFGYELLVEQDLDDGLYHEPSEQAAALRVQARRCAHTLVGWPSSQLCCALTACKALALGCQPGPLQAAPQTDWRASPAGGAVLLACIRVHAS